MSSDPPAIRTLIPHNTHTHIHKDTQHLLNFSCKIRSEIIQGELSKPDYLYPQLWRSSTQIPVIKFSMDSETWLSILIWLFSLFICPTQGLNQCFLSLLPRRRIFSPPSQQRNPMMPRITSEAAKYQFIQKKRSDVLIMQRSFTEWSRKMSKMNKYIIQNSELPLENEAKIL